MAPETKLPEIIADLEDAFRWIRAKAAGLARLDASQMAVLGASAGGYLTLTAGYRVLPRVKALVSFYGYGDLIGDWQSQPRPHPRHYDRPGITRVEAYRHVAGLPVSDSRENLLVEMLSLELMPPDDEPKLTPEQIEVIRSWIDAGAHSRAGAPTELLGTLAPKLVTARKAFEVLEHKLGQLPETLREDARKAIEQSPDQRDEIQKYLVEKLFGFLFVNPAELPSLFPEFKEKATPLQEKIASLEAERKSLPKIRGLTDTTAVPNRAAGLSWPKGALAGPPCSIAKI